MGFCPHGRKAGSHGTAKCPHGLNYRRTDGQTRARNDLLPHEEGIVPHRPANQTHEAIFFRPEEIADGHHADSHRLLLREAVQRAEAPDQIHGVDAHNGTVAEQFAQNAKRHAVVRVVKGRDDDGGVANIKIRVARR